MRTLKATWKVSANPKSLAHTIDYESSYLKVFETLQWQLIEECVGSRSNISVSWKKAIRSTKRGSLVTRRARGGDHSIGKWDKLLYLFATRTTESAGGN